MSAQDDAASSSPAAVAALASAVAATTAQEVRVQLNEIREEVDAKILSVMDHVRKEFVENRLFRAAEVLLTVVPATVGLAMVLPPGLAAHFAPGALGFIWSLRMGYSVAKKDATEEIRKTSVTRPLTAAETATVRAAPLAKFMDFFEYAAYPLLFLPLTPGAVWLARAWLGGAAATVLAAPRIFRKLCQRAERSKNVGAGADAGPASAGPADAGPASAGPRWYRGVARELASGGFVAALLVARLLNLSARIFKQGEMTLTVVADHPISALVVDRAAPM